MSGVFSRNSKLKTRNFSGGLMNEQLPEPLSRRQIGVRLLYTLLFAAIFCILKFLILVTTLFQFVLLFITLKHSEPVRTFANRVVSYAYHVWRYITLNTNQRPFPFAEFSAELELPEEEVSFP
jgi:hypothetical protein